MRLFYSSMPMTCMSPCPTRVTSCLFGTCSLRVHWFVFESLSLLCSACPCHLPFTARGLNSVGSNFHVRSPVDQEGDRWAFTEPPSSLIQHSHCTGGGNEQQQRAKIHRIKKTSSWQWHCDVTPKWWNVRWFFINLSSVKDLQDSEIK